MFLLGGKFPKCKVLIIRLVAFYSVPKALFLIAFWLCLCIQRCTAGAGGGEGGGGEWLPSINSAQCSMYLCKHGTGRLLRTQLSPPCSTMHRVIVNKSVPHVQFRINKRYIYFLVDRLPIFCCSSVHYCFEKNPIWTNDAAGLLFDHAVRTLPALANSHTAV